MRHAIRFIVGVLILGCGGSVQGALITFQFEGTVDSVQDTNGILGGKVKVGDAFFGEYRFDLATPDLSPANPSYGSYSTAAPFSLTAGRLELTSTQPGRIIVHNDSPNLALDRYFMGNSGFTSNGLDIVELFILLIDPTMLAFSDDQLHAQPPDLVAFAGRGFSAEGRSSTVQTPGSFRIEGTVTGITPEPSSLFCILVAGALMRL